MKYLLIILYYLNICNILIDLNYLSMLRCIIWRLLKILNKKLCNILYALSAKIKYVFTDFG